ncbi:MAG: RluA family pseudouridine synthase [Proteobacteria bacterium]|nr:RluA family pseudouridine synthase [Pseudomonadota bacterium]
MRRRRAAPGGQGVSEPSNDEAATAGPIEVRIAEANAGARLDRALAAALADISRSRLKSLVEAGAVTLAGRTISDAGRRVKPGEIYALRLPEAVPAEPEPEAIALSVAYEDDALIVIDKPAGLVVHPAAGHATGTLVNALIAHCGASLSGIGGVKRPGIVHRLDKDTSGLLVVAKTDIAHRGLSDQFKAHGADGRLTRRYQALVWGIPFRQQGRVDAPLGRSRANRTRIAVTQGEDGRHAVTHYRVLETFTGEDGKPLASFIELELETGRTHQIRVHLAHIGHPVMGDPLYATGFQTGISRLGEDAALALTRLARQALHAAHLGFEHPETSRSLAFDSPLPSDISNLLSALRKKRKPGKPAGRLPRIKS